MPIYEYECLKCGQRFELLRHITDSDSNIRCPKCGAENPQRVISAFMTGHSTGGCAPSSPT
jgi:putative FmdB family regulatory protein